MIIEEKEILGGFVGDELVCKEHLTKEEYKALDYDEILTEMYVADEKDLFFCDRCNKKIAA